MHRPDAGRNGASAGQGRPDAAGGSKRRRRRGAKRRPGPATPVEVIASSRKPTLTDRPVEEPLSPAEVLEMREHFRFLKEHRKVLHLRLNAQEDLLVNGARPPTHRGVCQHLLSKVDRARVTSAIERMSPSEALFLAQGMVRMSPDIGYVLLYLECVKRAASGADATAALLKALKQLRFSEVSPAQMRRVLDLIVELFDARELPQLVVSLLGNGAFRAAFDSSTKDLPAALSDILLPLRAAQAVVVADRKNPCSPRDLRRGIELFLTARESTLRAHPEEVRERLFGVAVALLDAEAADWVGRLRQLLRTFEPKSRRYGERALDLARACLRLGRDDEARRILEEIAREHPELGPAKRWLAHLNAPRSGRVALVDVPPRDNRSAERREAERPPAAGREGHEHVRFRNGFWLDQQLDVWICHGTASDAERFERAAGMYRRTLLPGVARCIAAGTSGDGRPYLALTKHGRSCQEVFQSRGGIEAGQAQGLLVSGVALLAMLGLAGLALPDVDPERFTVDEQAELRVRDLFDARAGEPALALLSNLDLAKEWLAAVARAARFYALPEAVLERAKAATDFQALSRALDRVAS